MSLFSKLFGGGNAKPEREPEIYKGFRIFPAPQSTGSGYRLAARIEKEVQGELKSHDLLRADVISSLEEAEVFSIRKAKQLIDEQGEKILS